MGCDPERAREYMCTRECAKDIVCTSIAMAILPDMSATAYSPLEPPQAAWHCRHSADTQADVVMNRQRVLLSPGIACVSASALSFMGFIHATYVGNMQVCVMFCTEQERRVLREVGQPRCDLARAANART